VESISPVTVSSPSSLGQDSTPTKSVESEDIPKSHWYLKPRRHSKDSAQSLSAVTKRIAAHFSSSNKPRNRNSAITVVTVDSIQEAGEDEAIPRFSPSISEYLFSPVFPSNINEMTTTVSMPLLSDTACTPIRGSPNRDVSATDSPSPGGSCKIRMIQPKIAALVEMFEEETMPGLANKENRPPESPIDIDDNHTQQKELVPMANDAQNSSEDTLMPLIPSNGILQRHASVHRMSPSYLSRSNGDAVVVSEVKTHPMLRIETDPPLISANKQDFKQSSSSPLRSKTNMMRSMPSIADLKLFRRKDSHREKSQPSITRRHCIDEEQARGWDEKVQVVAEWVSQSLANGRMDDFPKDRLEDSERTDRTSSSNGIDDAIVEVKGGCSVEQDLIDSVLPAESSHPAAAYAVGLLGEVREYCSSLIHTYFSRLWRYSDQKMLNGSLMHVKHVSSLCIILNVLLWEFVSKQRLSW
jgi:hypothetical protein